MVKKNYEVAPIKPDKRSKGVTDCPSCDLFTSAVWILVSQSEVGG